MAVIGKSSIPQLYNYVSMINDWHVFAYIALLVPLVGILVVVIDDKYKYTVQGFPQTFCIPNDATINFCFILLPVIVALAMTACQLIIVIWLIHKVPVHPITNCFTV